MHAAPPVRMTLGRSLGWVAFEAAWSALAVGSLAAWGLQRFEQPAWPALALAGVAAAAGAAWGWRSQPPTDLVWDGARWQMGAMEGSAWIALDLNGWLLLRFDTPQGGRRWIAASRRSATGPWAAWRAALYSSRPADPLDPQQP